MKVDVAEWVMQASSVVALESTIVAHGMPYPDNRETQLACARAAEQHGATAATIAVIDGVARVGLSSSELERLSHPDSSFVKAATRDLPAVLARSGNAATTVSSSAFIAAKVRWPIGLRPRRAPDDRSRN